MNQQTFPAPTRPSFVLMAPPPLIFGAAFGLGVVLQRAIPAGTPSSSATLHLAGAAVLAVGVLLAVALATGFLMRRTTLNPFAEPSAFFATGPYNYSRNPMYLSLVVAYLGATLAYGSAWPLLTLAVPLAVLARVVVPYEEARMRLRFGHSYEAYCARTRRWI